MSWFNRRTLIALPLALVMGACGFTPVHAPGGAGQVLYGNVRVQAPEEIPSNSDVAAFFLVDALEQDLGRGEGGIYALDLSVKQTVEGQAITADNDITRFSVQGTANYTLRRLSDGVVVTSGAVDNFTGYSATGSTVDTLAGERDAEERLMRILADQIVTRLFTTADLGPVGSE
ncbi:hypothetical protein GFB49_06725 [Epibacterium sp. SM1979]|uniref:LPS-assembly lipoprotein n=1 Tax=Tritonibacter litoralis TaxID=2662264 RepID=A0A843YA19_9RHOB|nr:LPS assembly lipoprotein LptE [Tritonibacter litoralis]MQQ08140.1 hypothetical protein [Tritonibacter litoralis]